MPKKQSNPELLKLVELQADCLHEAWLELEEWFSPTSEVRKKLIKHEILQRIEALKVIVQCIQHPRSKCWNELPSVLEKARYYDSFDPGCQEGSTQ